MARFCYSPLLSVLAFIIFALFTLSVSAKIISIDYTPTAVGDTYGLYFKTAIKCNGDDEQPILCSNDNDSAISFQIINQDPETASIPIPWSLIQVNYTWFDSLNTLYSATTMQLPFDQQTSTTGFVSPSFNVTVPVGSVLHGIGFISLNRIKEAELMSKFKLLFIKFTYRENNIEYSDMSAISWYYKAFHTQLAIMEEFQTTETAQKQHTLELTLTQPAIQFSKLQLYFNGMISFHPYHGLTCLVNGVSDLPTRFITSHEDEDEIDFHSKTAFEIDLKIDVPGYKSPYFDPKIDLIVQCTGFSVNLPQNLNDVTKACIDVSLVLIPLDKLKSIPYTATFTYDNIYFRMFPEGVKPLNYKLFIDGQMMLTDPKPLTKEDRAYGKHKYINYYSDILLESVIQDGLIRSVKVEEHMDGNGNKTIVINDPISFQQWDEHYIMKVDWLAQNYMELDLSYTLSQMVTVLMYNTTGQEYIPYFTQDIIANGTVVFPTIEKHPNKAINSLKSSPFKISPQPYTLIKNLTDLIDYDPNHPITVQYEALLTFHMRLFYDVDVMHKPDVESGYTPTISLYKIYNETLPSSNLPDAPMIVYWFNNTQVYSHNEYTAAMPINIFTKGGGLVMQRYDPPGSSDSHRMHGFSLQFNTTLPNILDKSVGVNKFLISLEGQEQYLFGTDASANCTINGKQALILDYAQNLLPYTSELNITNHIPQPRMDTIHIQFPFFLQSEVIYNLQCNGKLIVPTRFHNGFYETDFARLGVYLTPIWTDLQTGEIVNKHNINGFDGLDYTIRLPLYFGAPVIRRLWSYIFAILVVFFVGLFVGAVVVLLLRFLNYRHAQKKSVNHVYINGKKPSRLATVIEEDYHQLDEGV